MQINLHAYTTCFTETKGNFDQAEWYEGFCIVNTETPEPFNALFS